MFNYGLNCQIIRFQAERYNLRNMFLFTVRISGPEMEIPISRNVYVCINSPKQIYYIVA